jgi:hypothetical protein
LGCCFQGLQQPTQKNSKSFWMEIETRGSLLFQVYHCQRFQFLRLGMSAVNKQEATISAKLHKNPGISNFYFHTLLQPKSKRKFTDAKSWDTPGARGVVLGLAVSLNIFKPEWVDRDRERGHTSSKEIESRDIVLADREL